MFDQLKNLKNLAGLMGNTGQIREKMEQMQEELSRVTAEAEAGAGAVRVVVNGKLEVVNVSLDPAMVAALAGQGTDADRTMVEELIVSATNEALNRAKERVQQEMMKLTGGLDVPGLDGLLK
ncbi:MAG: YbaB/EbfC family nucleoid-associated protein [Phycisphaeraceae bacterium]